tara:strand:- start:3130 stop:3573 length:444 start_codon:yes stop_codon:yes gene_type:complete
MANVAIADIRKSVKVGESQEKMVVDKYIAYLEESYPNHTYKAIPFPPLASLDYLILADDNIFCYLEIKVRTKYFDDTIVPMTKELVALFDFNYHKIPTWLLIYTMADKSLRLFDMSAPPGKRATVTRKDRNVTSHHSFYGESTTIKW